MLRTCKTAHWYGGKDRTPGEKFEVDAQDLEFQIVSGRVEREAGDKAPGWMPRDMATSQGYMTRDMTAQPKRSYNRRAA